MTVAEFAEALALYASLADASVTSWGRTRLHNDRVGGVPLSAHRFWRAADVTYDVPGRLSADDRKELARRLGLRLIVEADHDHLQPLDWTPG